MSTEEKEVTTEGATDFLSNVNPVMLVSVAVGAVLVALFALISLVLLLSMSSDISHLEDQMRKLGKTTKVMEQELADLRTALAPSAPRTQGEGKPKPAAPKASHLDASDPAKDCVVRSGSKGGVADCFK